MAVSEDGTTPAVATTAGGATVTSLTSASFSPPAGTVLLALCIINWNTYPGTVPAITVSDTAGGTWTAGPVLGSSAAAGKVATFTRPCVTAPGSLTVTMSRSPDNTAAMLMLAVRVLDGAQVSAPQGAAPAGTAGASTPVGQVITPTVLGSLLYVLADLSGTNLPAVTSGTTAIANTNDPTDLGYLLAGRSSVVAALTAQTLGWSYAGTHSWVTAALEILPLTTITGAGALSGSGTLGGAGVLAGAAALSGTGTLTGTGTSTGFGGGGTLSGSGTLSGTGTGTFLYASVLTGLGTLSGTWTAVLLQAGALDGEGTLSVPGVVLKFPAALAGSGTLSVLQATGGLVFATPGGATPQAYPLSSQVAVAAPGSSYWQYLGTVGVVTALTYSFTCPGGADQMTATVMVPAAYRTQLFNPGWQVRITRGGHTVWTGKMDEPAPTASGWNLTASGDGNRGTDYLAIYTSTWPAGEPDESVNNAIGRGMPWVNPGIGTPSGAWFGQAIDSGAQTITALLTLICTRGGLTWYVNSQPGGYPGSDLSVFPLPTAPNRLLTSNTPVARTLGADTNTIWIRYEVTADNSATGAPAVYNVTSVQNAQSVAAHGVLETYIDLSSAGVMTQAAVQAVANHVLAIYQRASFAGPFTASYGQLTNLGGAPIDPGADQAGTVCKLILTDFGFGGEVAPQFPITFIVGSYSWNDMAQVATISPYQNVDSSLQGLLSMENTTLTPIAAAGG